MKLSLMGKLRLKRVLKYCALVVLLALSAGAIATNFFGKQATTAAGITSSGDSIILNGGNYSVDIDGKIYQDPGLALHNQVDDNTKMDPSYLSYLYEPTAYTLNPVSTSLALQNGANLVVEKELNVKNLTMGANTRVTAPPLDSGGQINHPLYDHENWAMRLTGYIKIPAHTILNFKTHTLDDALFIESSLSNNINGEWQPIYSQANFTGWGPNLNLEWWDFQTYLQQPGRAGLLTNTTDAPIYKPIRVSMANSRDNAWLDLVVFKFNPTNWTEVLPREENDKMPISWFFGTKADGTVNTTSGQGKANFEYFLSRHQTINTLPGRSLSRDAAVRTISKDNIDLADDFNNGFGVDAGLPTKMVFQWRDANNSNLNLHTTPVADVRAIFEGRYASTKAENVENLNLIDYSKLRRIPGGIEINCSGRLYIQESAVGIDLSGKGYPGFSYSHNRLMAGARGSSLNLGDLRGSPGGGYTTGISNNWVGSAGSHAGIGGNFMGAANVPNAPYSSQSYGSRDNPTTLGSGAGGSAEEDSGRNNFSNGGNGGGMVSITAAEIDIRRTAGSLNPAVSVNGGAGEREMNPYYSWVGTGGAGGTIRIDAPRITLTAPNTNLFSARGAGYLDTPLNGYLYGMDGQNKYRNFSGGGGGYLYIRFGSDSSNVSVQQVIDYSDVSGGSGNPVVALNLVSAQGGDGYANVDASDTNGFSILKTLEPFKRNNIQYDPSNPETYFNPYALMPHDIIKVNIHARDVKLGTVITDKVLKQAASRNGYWYCLPQTLAGDSNIVTIQSSLGDEGQYYDSALSPEVKWIAGQAASEADFSYYCEVTKR